MTTKYDTCLIYNCGKYPKTCAFLDNVTIVNLCSTKPAPVAVVIPATPTSPTPGEAKAPIATPDEAEATATAESTSAMWW